MDIGKARMLFTLALGGAALELAWASRALPPTMASHFDAAGRANAYGGRGGFVLFFAGVLALLALVFALVPRALRRAPDALINLPHKDHWLSPERREATFDDLEARMLIFGVATVFLLCYFLGLTVRFNGGDAGAFVRAPRVALAAYVLFALLWLAAMGLRYGRLPGRQER